MAATAGASDSRAGVEARHGAWVAEMERPAPVLKEFGEDTQAGRSVERHDGVGIRRILVVRATALRGLRKRQ
jgi:hypothetical protein